VSPRRRAATHRPPASRRPSAWHRRPRERGAALVLALWVLLVLGMASLQILAEARARVDTAALARSETVARYAAESGVVAAEALLDGLVRGASPQEQALVFEQLRAEVAVRGVVPLDAGRYQVVVEDLNSRIDLNRSSPEILEGLLAQFVSPGTAGSLVRALWGEELGADEVLPDEFPPPADSAGPDGRVDEALPGLALDRPLMHLEELTLVPGFSETLVAAIAPYVTVSGDGFINANTAPEPVLAAVPDVGDVRAPSLVHRRDRDGPLTSKVALYSALAEGGTPDIDPQLPDLVTATRRVLVVARGWEEGHPYTHEIQAVFEVVTTSPVRGPYVALRSWSERGR
jgi:general secretion pathway protein K